ncbi:MAG: hypothetical protein GYA42_04015 [Syntrophomonadaceae bacterium]|nr:hypothetical protein [Syntrophomonadaceae bacterium]
MKELFRSALDRIKADEALIGRTEARLREDLLASHEPRIRTKRGRNYQMKKLAIAACMAVMLLGGGFAWATPTSYLSVDINPSVELGINALDRVVRVQALNEDGTVILEGLSIKGLQVDEAVSLIVDAAAEQGYIEKDGSSIVSITAGTDNKKKADALTADAEEGVREALEKNEVAAEVSMAAISQARWEAARALDISPGKMNLYQKLWAAKNQNSDEELTAGNYDEEIMAFAEEFADDNFDGQAPADVPVKSIMQAIKDARGDAGEDADSDEVGKPGKGKANAPGQQLKAGSGDAQDQVSYLPNGKTKKNAPDDEDEEEE